jgi:hypothetical protein
MRKGVKEGKMKKRLTMLVAAMVIFGLIGTIVGAAAANYVYVESNVKGVGWKNVDYTVDTQPGIATGIEMRELESGTGIVTAQKWTLEVNKWDDDNNVCIESLEEKKIFDVEYFPITYQNLSYDQKWMEKKCVKNYVIGAVTDAYFDQCERLAKEETVVTYTGLDIDGAAVNGIDQALTQTITADVLGKTHIGFAAKDSEEKHHTIAVGLEETIGDFRIEKTIEIRLNCSIGQIGDWLGCP